MSRTLLLADDSPVIRRLIELTFAREGLRVVAVADGEQAIARIPVERPDVVLASIGTARRSGYDVAAFVTGQPDGSRVPVLLMASAFEPVDEERARRAGSAGVLVKPFDPPLVVARVRELLDGARRGEVVAVDAASTPSAEPPVAGPESRAPSPQAPLSSPESRATSPEPSVPSPSAGNGAALDDYFSRLEGALTTRAASRPPVPASTPAADDSAAPTAAPSIADVLEGGRSPLPVEITDELVDRIAERVVERLKGEPSRPGHKSDRP